MPVTKNEINNTKSLLTRKGRRADNKFLAEGVRLLEEAVRFRARPEIVYWNESMLSPRGLKLVAEFGRMKVPVEALPARFINTISGTETPQGLVAVFPQPETDLTKLCEQKHRRILLCEEIQDPGNLGTLLRSALAFGFELIILIKNCVDPFSLKVVRSSAGALFGLDVAIGEKRGLIGRLQKEKVTVMAADAAGKDIGSIRPLCRPEDRLMLAVGSEARGLSRRILDQADHRVRIAHSRNVESLNAAVAGSVIMRQVYDLSEG